MIWPNLRLTNNEQVLQSIPMAERASSVQQHELDGDVKKGVLGVYWNNQDDKFLIQR